MITLLSILLIMSAFEKDAADRPVSLPGLSLSHIIPFYKRRYDFLNWGIQAAGQNIFQFKLLRVSLFWSSSLTPWRLMILLSYFLALYAFTSTFFAVLPIMVSTPYFDTMTLPLPSGTNPMIYHQNTVIVVSGESGRQVFFSAKGLDLIAGFKILSGAVCITVLIRIIGDRTISLSWHYRFPVWAE